MSSYRFLGIKIIAILLLASAVVSILVAYYYLIVISRIIPIRDWGMLAYPEYWREGLVILIISYLAGYWLLTAQLIFYPLLSVVFIVLAAGLLRMKNWARIITIIYALLTLLSFILILASDKTFISIGGIKYPLFNPNIFWLLFGYIPSELMSSNYALLYLFIKPFIILPSSNGLEILFSIISILVPIVYGILIIFYLTGDVKHEFT